MCGIYASVKQPNSKDISQSTQRVFDGLKRMLYRGYDSWGIATSDGKSIKTFKQVGVLDKFPPNLDIDSNTAIGHTRWATHGSVNKVNAHPHASKNKKLALVHNGIVENFDELKAELINNGEEFVSETDSEVILKLLQIELEANDMKIALKNVYQKLEGRNTIVVLTEDESIWAVRFGSPLIIGIGKNEIVLSSDVVSLSNNLRKMVFVDNNQIVHITKSLDYEIFDIKTLKKIQPKLEQLTQKQYSSDKAGYEHYMLKEINESSNVIRNILKIYNDEEFKSATKLIKKAGKIYTIGSGSAGVAAGQIAYYLRTVGNVNATSLIGADADSYYDLFDDKTVIIAPSQSGETADVIEGV